MGSTTTIDWMRLGMAVRPPPAPGTGRVTADPIEACPVDTVVTSIATPS